MKSQLKMTQKRYWKFLLPLLIVSLLAAPNAFGEIGDTNAGATISNQATINYQVGGVDQTGVLSDNDGNAGNGLNATEFLVDHKVKPLVAQSADATVVPNSTGQYLTYTVTNAGNTDPAGTLDILLDFEASGTDNFDMLVDTVQIYMENGLQADLQTSGANQDTLVTDYVPATDVIGYVSLVRDTPTTVYLVADTPSTPTNGQTADYWLVATAWDPGAGPAAPLAEDGDGDDAAASEVVWADDESLLPSGDTGQPGTAPDGKHAAMATYTVSATTLDVQKDSAVQSDPFNSVAPFYRVPGAVVRYTISVTNTGTVDATGLQLVDEIPAGTDYIVGNHGSSLGVASIEYSDSLTPPAVPGDWLYAPGAAGADAAITWIRITLTNPLLGSGGPETAWFDVEIE